MRKRDLIASSCGNTLEWFDFGLFIFMAPIIGQQFFPMHDSATATLAAFGVFAAGFICRPLGGIFFGHRGDTKGRANTLRLSILMITFATFTVGCLPTYQTAGILAPILFTLLRLIQGISVGGEYSGVMIYLAESAPSEKRGFITSFSATGANVGFLLATLTVMLLKATLSAETISAFGWRLPFIFIGVIGSVILYYRFRLVETPVYTRLQAQQVIEKKPFFAALRYAPGKLLKILGLTCVNATFYYVFFGYMPEYLVQYMGISSNVALGIESMSLVLMLFLVPLAGILGDRIGRKNMLLLTAFSVMLLSIPCFYLLQDKSLPAIMLAMGIATIISSMDQGNTLTAVVENCPAKVRYTGVAFSYNLGMALFGGTAPLVVGLLTQKVSYLAPAYYLMVMAGVTLVAVVSLVGKYQNSMAGNYPENPSPTRGEGFHPNL